ncbi:HK97 gp10 family phage protein [Paenibacillus sp. GXUN7292]|uniref:HK97 gp10 family phage protein n=1 Tax=Paenibacillus sp. GXUN7292 TaxID=3422499 RepID=UPI003D7F149D
MAGAKGFSFNLDGLEAMISALDAAVEEIDARIDATLERLALKIIHDAKRLAPIDTGDLEAALIVGEVKKLIGVSYIDFGTSPEVNDYAVVQHEGFRKTASGKIVQLTPGEKTRSKGAYNGELPGAKYLERAIKMNEKLIIEELSKILEG